MPAAAGTADGSGVPLARKLGLKTGSHVVLLGAPDEYPQLIHPLPDGVRFDPSPDQQTDLVHLFTVHRGELEHHLSGLRQQLRPDAAVWVSWPKLAARIPTEVNEHVVREIALPLGFVDIKICAVSLVWSGLKLVVRKELR